MENGRIVLDGDGARLRHTATSRSSISARPPAESAAATATSSSTAEAGDGMAELEIHALSLRFGGLRCSTASRFVLSRRAARAYRPQWGRQDQRAQLHQRDLPREGGIRFRGTTSTAAAARIAKLGIARTFQHGELFPAHEGDGEPPGRPPRALPHHLLPRGCFLPSVRREEADSARRWRDHRVRRARPPRDTPVGRSLRHAEDRRLGARAGDGAALLLLDEPSAGLIARSARISPASSCASGTNWLPMIWIEHDMQMVGDLADRIHVLAHGPPAGRRAAGRGAAPAPR